jgi:1-deoxyxylulose-5-phosphate synthase
MKYRKLGRSGLDVSGLCLGCMSFGDSTRGGHAWALDDDRGRPIMRRAVEAGINFFDTANMYSGGSSEEVTGRLLKEFTRRDEIVIATKVFFAVEDRPNAAGLSRKAIMQEIDKSLRRLDTDYIDLYQIHRFDHATPIEETMEALHDVVKAGKARYIGANSMAAWQFARMQHVADINGWTRFVSMQNYVNLLYREEEREMLPLCIADGIGVTPWSPLARGALSRSWDSSTQRGEADKNNPILFFHTDPADRLIIERVEEVARTRGVPMAQVALAWLIAKPGITAPIVGASREGHLDDAVAALDLVLTDGEIERLEEAYVPHKVMGFV